MSLLQLVLLALALATGLIVLGTLLAVVFMQ
jgi:hypothetical protein